MVHLRRYEPETKRTTLTCRLVKTKSGARAVPWLGYVNLTMPLESSMRSGIISLQHSSAPSLSDRPSLHDRVGRTSG